MDLTYSMISPNKLLGYAEILLRLSDRFGNALIMLSWSEERIRSISAFGHKAYK